MTESWCTDVEVNKTGGSISLTDIFQHFPSEEYQPPSEAMTLNTQVDFSLSQKLPKLLHLEESLIKVWLNTVVLWCYYYVHLNVMVTGERQRTSNSFVSVGTETFLATLFKYVITL